MPDIIEKYFPGLTSVQKDQFSMLKPLYEEWNSKINVISRKDMDNFYMRHVLHSIAIAKIISFVRGTSVLDVGTGGGFPGIPLAIMFPGTRFSLLDSIQKKIKVVTEVTESLKLQNVIPLRARVEEHRSVYDFVISRAVTSFPEFIGLTSGRIRHGGINTLKNGIIYLKGGDLTEELGAFGARVRMWDISQFFSESFFETKKMVYLQV
jgi:16S rRNA (guanine527-N7)-methyltransferase